MIKRAMKAFQNGLDAVCDEKWFRLYGNGLCIAALLIAKYGAGFSWRQVLVGYLVYGIWQAGSDLLQCPCQKTEFQRVQFRIELTYLGQALIDAGIYSEDEVKQNSGALRDCVGRCNCYNITFTWMEQDLFFLNDENRFESRNLHYIKSVMHLKPFGNRALKIDSDFWYDRIELRGRDEYELVLIKYEDQIRRFRYGSSFPVDDEPTVTLIKLPWELFRSLQEPLKGHGSLLKRMTDRENREHEILKRTGLKYWQDDEMSDVWHYQGKYASLDWETF